MINRRRVLGSLTGAVGLSLVGGRASFGADRKLSIISHAVHKQVVTVGPGGDLAGGWATQNGYSLGWQTYGIAATNEHALREASLAESNIDVVFLLDRYMAPQYARLFEDLSDYNKKEPITNFDEIPLGMRAAHTFGNRLAAIPFRHATHGLHYNTALLSERGIAGPPKSVAELLDVVKKLTYTRDDGTRVYGLALAMDDPSAPIDWIRGFGGDFITPDYKVVIDTQETIDCVTMLCELVKHNLMPKNTTNLKSEDLINMMQQGRAAMTNHPFGRHTNYNDPKASKFSGKISVSPLPLGLDGRPTPAKTSVWGIAIPRNAKDKPMSWNFIRHLSEPENTVRAAMNSNGPVRPSAYDDVRVSAAVPYAAAEKEATKTARLVVPSFPEAQRSMDIFMEELGLALLGHKTPKDAMANIRRRVEPLLPS